MVKNIRKRKFVLLTSLFFLINLSATSQNWNIFDPDCEIGKHTDVQWTTVINDKLYIVYNEGAGCPNYISRPVIDVYDLFDLNLAPQRVYNGPCQNYFFGLFNHNSLIYFFSGGAGFNSIDPQSGVVTQLQPVPITGNKIWGGVNIVEYGGDFYVLLQDIQFPCCNQSGTTTAKFFKYSVSSNAWTQLTSPPGDFFSYPTSHVIGNELFVKGSFQVAVSPGSAVIPINNVGTNYALKQPSSNAFKYNFTTQQWTNLGSLNLVNGAFAGYSNNLFWIRKHGSGSGGSVSNSYSIAEYNSNSFLFGASTQNSILNYGSTYGSWPTLNNCYQCPTKGTPLKFYELSNGNIVMAGCGVQYSSVLADIMYFGNTDKFIETTTLTTSCTSYGDSIEVTHNFKAHGTFSPQNEFYLICELEDGSIQYLDTIATSSSLLYNGTFVKRIPWDLKEGRLYVESSEMSFGSDIQRKKVSDYLVLSPFQNIENIAFQNYNILFANNENDVSYQWYRNGFPITGETNFFHSTTSLGIYYCLLTKANGCTKYSDTIILNTLGGGLSQVNYDILPHKLKMDSSSTSSVLPSYSGNGMNPGARIDHATWRVGDSVFVYGGRANSSVADCRSDLWVYNITTESWSFLGGSPQTNNTGNYSGPTHWPRARYRTAHWAINDSLFIYGGMTFSNLSYQGTNLADIWVYDIGENRWSLLDGSDATNVLNATSFPNSNDCPSNISSNVPMFHGSASIEWVILPEFNEVLFTADWPTFFTNTINSSGFSCEYGTRVYNYQSNTWTFLNTQGYNGKVFKDSLGQIHVFNNGHRIYNRFNNTWTFIESFQSQGANTNTELIFNSQNKPPNLSNSLAYRNAGHFVFYLPASDEWWIYNPNTQLWAMTTDAYMAQLNDCENSSLISDLSPLVFNADYLNESVDAANFAYFGNLTNNQNFPQNTLIYATSNHSLSYSIEQNIACNGDSGVARLFSFGFSGPTNNSSYSIGEGVTQIGSSAWPTVCIDSLQAQEFVHNIFVNSDLVHCFGDTVEVVQSNELNTYIYDHNLIDFVDTIGSSHSRNDFKIFQSGEFSVVSENTYGCIDSTYLGQFIFNPTPSGSISYDQDSVICGLATIKLISSKSPNTIIEWYRADSLIASGVDSILTGVPGVFYARIVNLTTGCNTTTNSLVVSQSTDPSASVLGVASQCANDDPKVWLDINSGSTLNSIDWYLDGQLVNSTISDTLRIMNSGSYSAIVTDQFGCSWTSSPLFVTIMDTSGVLVSAASATQICPGDSVKLTAFSSDFISSYQWYREGLPIAGATDSVLFAALQGSYLVEATNMNGCNSSSNFIVIDTLPLPNSDVYLSGSTTFCLGDSIVLSTNQTTGLTYQWKDGGVDIVGANQAIYTATQTGTYSVEVVNSSGCTKESVTTTVTVFGLPSSNVSISGNPSFCEGESVVLIGPFGTGYSYQWMNNGVPLSGETGVIYSATQTGTYSLEVTTANGCSSESPPISVSSNPYPIATVSTSGTTTFCQGDSVVLSTTPSSGLTYQWKDGGVDIVGANQAIYTATQTGVYSVEVTNSSGCAEESTTTTVTVNDLPPSGVSITGNLSFCQGDSTVLTGPSGTSLSYQWIKDGSPLTGENNIDYTATQTGNYSLQVTDVNGCTSQSSPIAILSASPVQTPTIVGLQSGIIPISNTYTYLVSNNTSYSYQWNIQNGAIINGQGTNSVEVIWNAETSGSLSVEVSSGPCLETDTISITTNIGIDDYSEVLYDIYPNPTNDIVTVHAMKLDKIIVYSLQGEMLFEVSNSNGKDMLKVSLSGLSKGVYFFALHIKQEKYISRVVKID